MNVRMSDEKPKNIDEYKDWLKKEYKFELSERNRTYYESVTNKVKKDFENSPFWIELTKNLKEIDSEYYLKNKYPLLIPEPKPQLYIKSFDSFFLKTFRKNILENNKWPNEPNGGWILPNNWYCKINDIIRTFFVVKYLDGVEFMSNKIQSLCDSKILPCDVNFEAKEEGYLLLIYTQRRNLKSQELHGIQKELKFQ